MSAQGNDGGMDAVELTGIYTYRSFIDRPEPVDDFNKLRFGQLELRLSAAPDGAVSGVLVFPAQPGIEPPAMDVSGTISAGSLVRFTGKGRPDTSISDFHYEYDGVVLPHWEKGIGQRMVVAGTVLRAADHGSGASLAKAGQTASFVAVKRDV
jgi:hypothetical protein